MILSLHLFFVDNIYMVQNICMYRNQIRYLTPSLGIAEQLTNNGYDPISRRHHVNYGDTSEWLWCTKKRVTIYKQSLEPYIESSFESSNKSPLVSSLES